MDETGRARKFGYVSTVPGSTLVLELDTTLGMDENDRNSGIVSGSSEEMCGTFSNNMCKRNLMPILICTSQPLSMSLFIFVT